jgi:hypothetical protein
VPVLPEESVPILYDVDAFRISSLQVEYDRDDRGVEMQPQERVILEHTLSEVRLGFRLQLYVNQHDLPLALLASELCHDVGLARSSVGKPFEELLVRKAERLEIEPSRDLRKKQLEELPKKGPQQFLEQLVVSHRALAR